LAPSKMGFPHGPTVTQNPDGTLNYRHAQRSKWQDSMRGGQSMGERLTWVAGDRPAEDLDEVSRKNLAAQPQSGTSIFDPVLCELAYRWFCPPDGLVLDPFAGGSVRGIVATCLGRRYFGVDLRPEQVAANEAQAAEITPDSPPTWVVGDSRNLAEIAQGREVDFIFSCPPYYDLEVYSDDPRDLSTLGEYVDFLADYRAIIAQAVGLLKEDRFACFVVGDMRDKAGIYRNFVSDTIAAFQDAGARLYNEAILVTAVGSLPIRVGRQFSAARKLGKTHQNVLVFVKGDPRRAADACGEIDAVLPEPDAE
jgi:DNA modification methylase